MTQNSTNLKFASSSTMTWVRWSWSLQKRNTTDQVNWKRWERGQSLWPHDPTRSRAVLLSNGTWRGNGDILCFRCLWNTQNAASVTKWLNFSFYFIFTNLNVNTPLWLAAAILGSIASGHCIPCLWSWLVWVKQKTSKPICPTCSAVLSSRKRT